MDRKLYKKNIQNELFNNTPNLEVFVGGVEDLLADQPNENDFLNNNSFVCKGVILGNIHVGRSGSTKKQILKRS